MLARNEWETELRSNKPDLTASRKTAFGPLLNKKLWGRLRPVFATRVRRKVFEVHRGNSLVELSIDKGKGNRAKIRAILRNRARTQTRKSR